MSGDAREINLVKAASQQPLIKTRDKDDPARVKIFNNLKVWVLRVSLHANFH